MLFDGYFDTFTSVKPKNRRQWKNDFAFYTVLDRCANDGVHRYVIDGLPDTCDPRLTYCELFWRGRIGFIERNGSILSLPTAEGGGPTVYGRYSSGYVTSLNGSYNKWVKLYLPGEKEDPFVAKVTDKMVDEGKGVIVHENYTGVPFAYYALYYAEQIADSLRTIETGRQHLKTPWIVTAEESVVESVKKFFKDTRENAELTVSSGVFDPTKVSVIPLSTAPDTIRTATELVQWYEARYRELCGLPSNTSVDKKGENLIQGELDVTQDYAEAETDNLITVLQEELDVANEHFGTNMKVRRLWKNERNKDISGDNGDSAGDGSVSGRSANRAEEYDI